MKTSQRCMYRKAGYTLIEIIVVMGIVLILFSLSVIGFNGIQQETSLNTTADVLVTDLRNQQLKAIIGETEGRSTHDAYGVYLGDGVYVLFHGPNYIPTESTNIPINLEGATEFDNVTFPGSTIIFASASGELVGFNQNNNSFDIINTSSGQHKTITINPYGVVTSLP